MGSLLTRAARSWCAALMVFSVVRIGCVQAAPTLTTHSLPTLTGFTTYVYFDPCATDCGDADAMSFLASVFNVTGGTRPWSTSASLCCKWPGVTCNETLNCQVVNITSIPGQFHSANLSFVDTFWNLTQLQYLDLKGVEMTPDSVFPRLRSTVQFFRAEGLSGSLSSFSAGRCGGLRTLDLTACQLTPPIKLSGARCPLLNTLRIANSGITGVVSGFVPQLTSVSLPYNNITGFNYTEVNRLAFIDVSHNLISSVNFSLLTGRGDLSYNPLPCPVPANNYSATCDERCETFLAPSNGAVWGACSSTARPGDRCYVSCGAGYETLQPTWQCRYVVDGYNGTWTSINGTGVAPNCTLRDPYCPAPYPDILNAHAISPCTSTPLDSLCLMECDAGMLANSSSLFIATCNESGSWDAPATCQAYDGYCSPLSAPGNGSLVDASACTGKLSATCQAACDDGYSLNTPARTCAALNGTTGAWTAAPFACALVPGYCPSYVVANGTTTCAQVIRGECTLQCDVGFVQTGSSPVCSAGGVWQGSMTCDLDMNFCPPVSSATCTGQYYGATCQPVCAGGLIPAGSLTCGLAKVWLGSMSCNAACPAIPSTTAVSSTCTTTATPFGGTCLLNCTSPYQGSLTRTCGSGSTWSTPAAPTCVATACYPAPPPVGAKFTATCASTTVPIGQSCVLRCTAGYVGIASFTCPVGGDWGATLTVACTPASCPAIASAPAYASACADNTTVPGGTCALRCGAGTFNATAVVARVCVQPALGVAADWASTVVPAGCMPCDFSRCAGGGVSTCNPTTGAITCGSCSAGWWGAACTQVCVSPQGSCQQVASCDQITGVVATCTPCVGGSICRNATGVCTAAVLCTGSGVCPASNPLADGSPCVSGHACMEAESCATGLCGGGAATGCCGSGTLEAGEGCDDGNRVSNDGCSASCVVEAGWSCLTPGAPCLGCPAGLVADCNQECGGTARIDGCGVCAGGATGRVANGTRDLCGVCGGGNVAVDDCGNCFGGNAAKDACGRCFGDGSTCKGCDGVPNSGKVPDACGLCGGDNSTCMGCDGLPIPSGGKRFDSCGVCGGNNAACNFDCHGIPHGPSQWDCSGVCAGTAVLNACGVCVGGTTGRAPLAGICNGVCSFNSTCDCPSSIYDVCGVCDGDNSTCRACDNSTTHGVPAFSFTCGRCNVNGLLSLLACNLGCDGVQDSGKVYDCNHDCGGAAVPDACGVCAGGLTGVIPGSHCDTCSVCFGGDRDKDLCGVCHGHNEMRDDCGICFGFNSHKDTCGICFGRDRTLDACGQCGGNGTWCLGCDSVPHSNMTLDACGVCGGNGICPVVVGNALAPTPDLLTQAKKLFNYGPEIAAAICACLLALLVFLLILRRRRRAKIGAYLANTKDTALAAAPSGVITMVFTDIQGSTALWEAMPDVMAEALDQHNELIRALLAKHNGYEVKTEGDAFRIAFQDVLDAITFSLTLQDALLAANFPPGIEKARDAQTEVAKDGTLLWRGLRVRMGMSTGEAANEYDARSQRIDYHGAMVTESQAVQSVASGGQIIISEASLEAYVSRVDPLSAPWNTTAMGTHLLKGLSEPVTMFQIQSRGLAARSHPPLRQAANVLVADTQRSARSPTHVSTRLETTASTARLLSDTASEGGLMNGEASMSAIETAMGTLPLRRHSEQSSDDRTVSGSDEATTVFDGSQSVPEPAVLPQITEVSPITSPVITTAVPTPVAATASPLKRTGSGPALKSAASTPRTPTVASPAKTPLARQGSGVAASPLRRGSSLASVAEANAPRPTPAAGWTEQTSTPTLPASASAPAVIPDDDF